MKRGLWEETELEGTFSISVTNSVAPFVALFASPGGALHNKDVPQVVEKRGAGILQQPEGGCNFGKPGSSLETMFVNVLANPLSLAPFRPGPSQSTNPASHGSSCCQQGN